ncbi:MAG: hypothetical protein WC856_21890 [Methylococcaceae bacterium]
MEVLELIEQTIQKITPLTQGLHVLAIQDTTELNYQAHAKRSSGLGTVGNGTDQGIYLYPMLTLNVEMGACLGLSGLKLWTRHREEGCSYWKLPIEEKEILLLNVLLGQYEGGDLRNRRILTTETSLLGRLGFLHA